MTIRPFQDDDASQVRELFVAVNRLLSPPAMRDAFEAYIAGHWSRKWVGSPHIMASGAAASGWR